VNRLRLIGVAAAAVLATTLTGCGGGEPATGDKLAIVASFYPLQFAAERVGGDAVTVTNLTKPGAEPHDLELAPADVADAAKADLVVYQAGFQPAVDAAVSQEVDAAKAFDAAPAAKLENGSTGGVDPHFWLDPTRLADVGDAIAKRLSEIDPDRADTYAANAELLRGDLDELDGRFAAVLSTCKTHELVTAHEAFGYLARRYELVEKSIAGLSPDAEPTPKQLAEASAFVEEYDITTIYYETLLSPQIAETVAKETGATTAVLDPIEGLTDSSAGTDYLTIMRANLDVLEKGQRCE